MTRTDPEGEIHLIAWQRSEDGTLQDGQTRVVVCIASQTEESDSVGRLRNCWD